MRNQFDFVLWVGLPVLVVFIVLNQRCRNLEAEEGYEEWSGSDDPIN